MRLSILVGSAALLLAAGQAFGQVSTASSVPTQQERVDQRETQRRAEVAEHQKRKEDFAKRCIKPGLSDAELESCRAAYRKL